MMNVQAILVLTISLDDLSKDSSTIISSMDEFLHEFINACTKAQREGNGGERFPPLRGSALRHFLVMGAMPHVPMPSQYYTVDITTLYSWNSAVFRTSIEVIEPTVELGRLSGRHSVRWL